MKAKLKVSVILAGMFWASSLLASEVKADEFKQNVSDESVTENEEIYIENEEVASLKSYGSVALEEVAI